jgi:pimeloyl-ACP methyl ester carboxylesterase
LASCDTIRRIVSVHGQRIAVLEGNPCAPGTPIVLLHGILGSIDYWPAALPQSILNERRWISIGLPGHFPGRFASAADAAQITPEIFADVLSATIRQVVPGEKALLVGYSTGGFAALNLAAREPNLVAGVLSIAGFAKGTWRGLLGRMQSLARRGRIGRKLFAAGYRVMAGQPWLFEECLLAHATKTIDRRSLRVAASLRSAAQDAQRQEARAMAELFARIRQFDIRPLMSQIRVPVVIAAGNRDPIIPFQHTCAIASAIPQARLVTFEGAGHLFHLECPDAFHTLLLDWVAKQDADHGTIPSSHSTTHGDLCAAAVC